MKKTILTTSLVFSFLTAEHMLDTTNVEANNGLTNLYKMKDQNLIEASEPKNIYDLPRIFRWNESHGNYVGRFYKIAETKYNSKDYKPDVNYYLQGRGEKLYYTPIPPEQMRTKPHDYNHGRVLENITQRTLRKRDASYFPTPFIQTYNTQTKAGNNNLKKGAFVKITEWNLRKNWSPNAGSMLDSNGNGNREWRYLGYDYNGDLISNPSFMPDYVGRTPGEGGHPLVRLGKYHQKVVTPEGSDKYQNSRFYIRSPHTSPLVKVDQEESGDVHHPAARPSKYSDSASVIEY